jgi:hypothetical protein
MPLRRITFLLNHWQDGTGLINNSGMPRPDMTRLMNYQMNRLQGKK